MLTKEGPKLTIIYSCQDCTHLNILPTGGNICNKLGKRISSVPDESCPFKIESAKNFHKNQILDLDYNENIRIRNILNKIFPDAWEHEIENNKISFINSESIDFNDIKKLILEFPNLDYFISPYDGNTLQFTATI